MLVIPVTSAKCEHIFNVQNHIKSEEKCSLSSSTLDNLSRVSHEGPKIESFDPTASMKRWLTSGEKPRRCNNTEWSTTKEWCTKLMTGVDMIVIASDCTLSDEVLPHEIIY